MLRSQREVGFVLPAGLFVTGDEHQERVALPGVPPRPASAADPAPQLVAEYS